MKRSIYFIFIILLYCSCDCEDHEMILLEEDLPDSFLVDSISCDDNYVTISFNRPVSQGAIVLGETFLLEGANSNYDGTPIIDGQTIRLFKCDFFCTNPPCMTEITLIGGSIRSTTGQLLDGDRDGTDGGDYVKEQEIEFCDPNPYVVSPEHLMSSSQYGCYSGFELETASIIFSQEMDTSSVILDSTFFLTQSLSNDGFMQLISSRWESETQLDLTFGLDDCGNCGMTIELLGDDAGVGVVKSKLGFALDGDKNGASGGNYEGEIIVLGTNDIFFPDPFQTSSTDYVTEIFTDQSGTVIIKTRIDVFFRVDVDTNTVVLNETLSLVHPVGAGVDVAADLAWGSAQYLIIQAQEVLDSCVLNQQGQCLLTLTIIGDDTGQGSVKTASDGLPIDGDRDCEPGGDYQTTFEFFP